jgi:hypothetical protein
MATKQELKKLLEDLNRKIAVLEWDKMRDQINPSKLAYLEELRKQRDKTAKDFITAVDEEDVKKETPTEAPAKTADEGADAIEIEEVGDKEAE